MSSLIPQCQDAPQIAATYGEQVMADFAFSQTDPHSTPYANRSIPDDPAIRLGVRLQALKEPSFLSGYSFAAYSNVLPRLLQIGMCSLNSVPTSQ